MSSHFPAHAPRPAPRAPAGEPLIRLRGLSKTFAVGGTSVHALRDVDLDIPRGEFCSVMGPSGAGKSTLMNVLGCIEAPDAGSYWLDGESVGALGDRALARVRNQSIGIVFQSFNLLPAMNARENVELPLVYAGIPAAERRRRAVESLERVGLGERQHHSPAQLSGGERQRVAIARALVIGPRIVLADEPTGNLDSNTAAEILNLLASIHADGNTVVCVTHDAEVARRADRILEVLDGRVQDDRAVRK